MARTTAAGDAVDIRIDGYIHVTPARVLPVMTAVSFWRSFDEDLALDRYHDRGAEGMRWYLSGGRRTRAAGTAEVWLEPYRDGTVAHLFVRATVDAPGRFARFRARRALARAEERLRRALFEAKDELEARYPR